MLFLEDVTCSLLFFFAGNEGNLTPSNLQKDPEELQNYNKTLLLDPD